MNLIEISSKEITLTGLLLNSSITLSNPHESLALMFQLECKPNILDIEPQRGMIMQKDHKYIKVNLKSHLRAEAERIQQDKNVIIVRATYFCEYNKKMMEKIGQEGWNFISKKLQEVVVPIRMNTAEEKEKIKRSIKIEDLQRSRKSNSFQKFRDSNIKKVKNSKLNEDLDFIFRNQQYKQKYLTSKNGQFKIKEQHYEIKPFNTSPQLFKTFNNHQSKDFSPHKISNINFESYKHVERHNGNKAKQKKVGHEDQQLQHSRNSKNKGHPKNSRGLEMIILAIIAGLSLALGEAFGSFLKY